MLWANQDRWIRAAGSDPRELAMVLAQHRLASSFKQPNDFVFATCTGGPLWQRNVGRVLRIAQRDALREGTPLGG